jgi:hypothetical protein
MSIVILLLPVLSVAASGRQRSSTSRSKALLVSKSAHVTAGSYCGPRGLPVHGAVHG